MSLHDLERLGVRVALLADGRLDVDLSAIDPGAENGLVDSIRAAKPLLVKELEARKSKLACRVSYPENVFSVWRNGAEVYRKFDGNPLLSRSVGDVLHELIFHGVEFDLSGPVISFTLPDGCEGWREDVQEFIDEANAHRVLGPAQ